MIAANDVIKIHRYRNGRQYIRAHTVTNPTALLQQSMDEEPSTSRGIKRYIPQELQDEVDVIAAKHPRVTGICTLFNAHTHSVNVIQLRRKW